MIELRIQEILGGKEVRQNLSKLRQELKESGGEDLEILKAAMEENREKWLALLHDEDAKIRKNAALLMGDIGLTDFVDALYEAFERESQRFVKSSYLKAIENFDYKKYVDRLKEHLKKLSEEALTPENRKHISEELKALSELIIRAEGIIRHRFKAGVGRDEILLATNRLHREVTMRQLEEMDGVSESQIKLVPAGLRLVTGSLESILPIRTYRELLFLVPGMKTCEPDAEDAAEKIATSSFMEFLEQHHEGNPPFYFRMDVRSKAALDKKSEFVKKAASHLEHMTSRRLINSPSSYEVEIRFVENREGKYNVLVKLHTIEDNRFEYRKKVTATGIRPVNAALMVELAKPYMIEDAKVLDPFCGVGTMLIERQKTVKGNTAYGIDILGEAIEGARCNTEEAGQIIHFINRDFFDFTHEHVFDEIFTDMPFALGRLSDEEVLTIHDRFLDRAKSHLTKEGTIILYTHNPGAVNRMAREKGYTVLKHFGISEKEGTELFILK